MDFLRDRKDLRGVDVKNEWKLIMTFDEIQTCIKKCADVINKKFEGTDIVLTCILKGAVYFHAHLSEKIIIPHSDYFIEASSYRNNQTQDENVELMSIIVPEKFKNKHVVLIDELYDNGHTLKKVKNAIHEKAGVPLNMIYTCTLFKKDKISHYEEPDLYGIIVPNVWLVGFGLDDQQEKRGWTHLFACPKMGNAPLTPDDEIFKNETYYKMIRQKITDHLLFNM